MSLLPTHEALDKAWLYILSQRELKGASLDFGSDKFEELEAYKYEVYDDARLALAAKRWQADKVGTGEILDYARGAAKKNYNLIDWRQVDKLGKSDQSTDLEKALWLVFKGGDSKPTLKQGFESLAALTSYQMAAFFFFLKDFNQYLPISQERFDKAFQYLGLDLRTYGQGNWENYTQFIQIHKEVKAWLTARKAIMNRSGLLDAHSFVYTLGRLLSSDKTAFISPSQDVPMQVTVSSDIIDDSTDTSGDIEDVSLASGIDQSLQSLDHPHTEDEDQFIDVLGADEGGEYYEQHKAYERNAGLIQRIKSNALIKGEGKIRCEACDFCFADVYGRVGEGFIEAHHNLPLADRGGLISQTVPEDIALLCSNCHSMIHRARPMLTVDGLRELLKNKACRA